MQSLQLSEVNKVSSNNDSEEEAVNMRNFAFGITILFVLFITSGCNNSGNAQENFTESYSGSFQSGSIVTDTNNDGFPANSAELVVHLSEYKS